MLTMTMLMDVFSGIGHFKLKTSFVIHCNKRCYDYEKNTVNKTNLQRHPDGRELDFRDQNSCYDDENICCYCDVSRYLTSDFSKSIFNNNTNINVVLCNV